MLLIYVSIVVFGKLQSAVDQLLIEKIIKNWRTSVSNWHESINLKKKLSYI